MNILEPKFRMGDAVCTLEGREKVRVGVIGGFHGALYEILYRGGAVHFTYEHNIRLATQEEAMAVGYEWKGEDVVKKPLKPKKKKRVPRKPALSTVLKKATHGGGVSSYALRFSHRGDKVHANDVCNARMKWPNWEGKAEGETLNEIVMDVNKTISKRFNAKERRQFLPYLNFILNDSPWAKCFITKSTSVAMRHGVKFNVDMGVSQLMGAAIALREGWEYGWKIPMFNKLLKKYPPIVAYMVASYFCPVKNGLSPDGFRSSHQVLSHAMSWEKLKKFLKNGYAKDGKPIRTVYENDYQVFNTIAPNEYDGHSLGNQFRKASQPIVKGKGFGEVHSYPKDRGIMLADWLVKELA